MNYRIKFGTLKLKIKIKNLKYSLKHLYFL